MTNSNTGIPILDDAAVAELEAVMTSGDSQAMYEAANVDNVRALCQTVRALRAENERLTNEYERWKRRATAQSTRNDAMLTDFTKALKKL